MSQIIAIYGKTCSQKSDVARAISHLTGYKLASRGELITTHALLSKFTSGIHVDLDLHKKIDSQTRKMVSWPDPVLILESRFMDAVLHDVEGIFFVRLTCDDEVRSQRWHKRREDGGGRSRQIGGGVTERDADDETLRGMLYPAVGEVEPNLEIDTSEGDAQSIAVRIWSQFTGEDLSEIVLSESEQMDKKQTKGFQPGSSAGEVSVYNAFRNPFGGYIIDDESGRNVFVHKGEVESSGLGELHQGQRVKYEIVEDGFGGFRATAIEAE